jgi:hypothetical protein
MPRGHYLTEAVKDAIWVLRAEGGERGRDQSPARYAEADGEQVPAADGRGPAEGTPSGGVLPDLG